MSDSPAAPLVSIGCAVYNGEATLERALQALVEQDYSHIEIVIVDDASTDRSAAICQAFASRDARVRVFRNQRNMGLTRTFNRVFAESRGSYFMWADQDDVRAPGFVGRTLAALQADPDAVLCHCHTAGFIGDPQDVKHIVTLKGVHGVRGTVERYAAFLRRYSDTTIYGLIRSDALRRTHLWRTDLGSANALLFELLLIGPFIEVPDVLYRYSGRGLPNRPGPGDEYARMRNGRPMPWYYLPFLVLARNQAGDILRSGLTVAEKAALLGVLTSSVVTTVCAKALYRTAARATGGRVPAALARWCEARADARPDITFVSGADRDERLFPRAWALKGERLRASSR